MPSMSFDVPENLDPFSKHARSDVDHPSHYNFGKIEVIDFIEDQQLGFHEGNVVKYICRAKHKGQEIKDLEKAKWYLERLISKKVQEYEQRISAKRRVHETKEAE